MPAYQLMFRPLDLSGYDLSGLLESSIGNYIVGEETRSSKDGSTVPLHYHAYIELNGTKETARNTIKRYLGIPSVKQGGTNKYYTLTPWEGIPDYMCKFGKVLGVRGWTPAEVLQFVESGRKKYLHKLERTPAALSGEVAPAPASIPKAKYNAYTELWHEYDFTVPTCPSVPDIARWIRIFYAKKGRAQPMHSLVMRYAHSIHCDHAYHVFAGSYKDDDDFYAEYFNRYDKLFSQQ